MRQIKLNKDGTLISLCSLNYSSSLALSEPASHQSFSNSSIPQPPRSLHMLLVLWVLCKYLLNIFSKLTLLERDQSPVLGKCREFPLREISRTAASLLSCTCMCCMYVRERGRKICFAWVCDSMRDCGENSWSAQAADDHVSSCSIDVLFFGMSRTGRSIWPYLHHPLLWNLITDIQLQSHHSLAVNIHWGSLWA